jgi:hypothetical protein
MWTPGECSLTAWLEDDPGTILQLTGSPLPYSASTGGLEARLAPLYEPGSVEGMLGVDRIELLSLPQTLMLQEATYVHDPDGDFVDLVQRLPFAAETQSVMRSAVDRGAAGYIGLLSGVPWETRDYYVPYDAVRWPLPGAWFSRADAAQLTDLQKQGTVRARLVSEGEARQAASHNVVGTLPGRSDEWVIVGSHHDGPWASAVEDASGVALVLAQAAHWSRVPCERRPHNMLFLVTAGHMSGAAGTSAFIAAHDDLLAKVVVEVHLEHAAAACEADGNGRLRATDQPEPRWWFTSRNPRLESAVIDALQRHDLRRSLVLRPTVFAPFPPTDGGLFHLSGVPLVSFLTAPMYLFDSQDTVDKVHLPTLEPLSLAAIDIIASTAGVTAASMRAGVLHDDRPALTPANLGEVPRA